MNLVQPRTRRGPVQAAFSLARGLSLPARNRTWNLPSPRPSLTTSHSENTPTTGSTPSTLTLQKLSRDTNTRPLAEISKISESNARGDQQHAINKPHIHARRPNLSTTSSKTAPYRGITRNSDEAWIARKAALKAKYPEGWRPGRKISPEAMEGIRILHRQVYSSSRHNLNSFQRPQFTNTQLGDFFKISPEAIRRILKSSWKPTAEEQMTRIERWQRRRQRIAAEAVKRQAFRKQATALQRYKRNLDSYATHSRADQGDHAVDSARINRDSAGVRTQSTRHSNQFPIKCISSPAVGLNSSPRDINGKPIRPSRHLRHAAVGSRRLQASDKRS